MSGIHERVSSAAVLSLDQANTLSGVVDKANSIHGKSLRLLNTLDSKIILNLVCYGMLLQTFPISDSLTACCDNANEFCVYNRLIFLKVDFIR